MPAGRPTLLTDDLKQQAREYLERDGSFASQLIVTIEGLALDLHCNRDSLYKWEKEDEEFSDILEELRQLQAHRLLQYGLKNMYNPTITKLMLSKHDYIEKKQEDITTNGKDLPIPILGGMAKNVQSDNGDSQDSSTDQTD